MKNSGNIVVIKSKEGNFLCTGYLWGETLILEVVLILSHFVSFAFAAVR